MVTPYVNEHKNILRSKHPEQSDYWITCEPIRTFGSWLQTHLMGNNKVEDDLYLSARTPSLTVLTFQGYEINRNTFYTITQDKRAPTKIVMSALMQPTPIGKGTHIMVT